jgi:acyl-CoA thioesterase
MTGRPPRAELRSPDDAQALAERCVGAMLERDAFSRWLGREIVAVAPDAASVRMTVRAEMLNGFGVCHGGVTFALADSALAFASNTRGRVTVSVENGISYPAPVHAGDVLTAEATPEATGQRVRFFRVVVRRQDDATVAVFRGTVYETRRALLPDVLAEPAPG